MKAIILAALFTAALLPAQSLSPAFLLDPAAGSLTQDPAEVIDGAQSIKGSYSGAQSYTAYLHTDANRMPLAPGVSYQITFRYKILTAPDKGFEVLFYSPTAGAQNDFLPSFTIKGSAGTSGTATLTNTLHNFPDYQARWNVIGTGAISIDDIQITEAITGTSIVSEDAEGNTVQYTLRQRALPFAQEARTFSVALDASGGVWPYTWEAGTINPPAGLELDADGYLFGQPTKAGAYLFDAIVTDSLGVTSRIPLRLTVNSATAPAIPNALSVSDNVATIHPKEYKLAFRNPLAGMRPNVANVKNHPFASLGRQYIPWSLLENDATDTVDKIRSATDQLFADLPASNAKAIPRVYLIWPDPLAKYWPADLTADDYSSDAFRARMKRLISRLGQAWDNDPRIAFIETGIIGYWGEQHDPSFITNGLQPSLPADMEQLFGDAFRDAFPHKLLMNRYPRNLTNYQFGTHWDVFGSLDRGFWGNDTTGMTTELNKPNMVDRWKIAPRGGEIDPTFLGEPDFTAASLEDVVRQYTPRLVGIIQNLHWNHLAVLETISASDSDLWNKASQIQNALGYRFVIDQADYTAAVDPGAALSVHLQIRNTGSSPLYYALPLEVALVELGSRRPVWHAIWDDVDLRAWLPGGTQDFQRSFSLPPDLAKGQYALTLAILDPSGLVPAARFAVTNYWAGGRTPLGPVSIGIAPASVELTGFDDLQSDLSLFYFPPITNLIAVDGETLDRGPLLAGAVALTRAPGIAGDLFVSPDDNWPTQLQSVTLVITDSQGQTQSAPIHSVSRDEISYRIPASLAAGNATLQLTTAYGITMTGTIQIAAPAVLEQHAW